MQSGQLEPIWTRGICKELAAQTTITIHLPLICSLRFVCPDPLIVLTVLAMLTLQLLTVPRWDFVFARRLLGNYRRCRSQNMHSRSTHIARCLHMAMLTCMSESEMSCEIGGVQLRTYECEFTAGDIEW